MVYLLGFCHTCKARGKKLDTDSTPQITDMKKALCYELKVTSYLQYLSALQLSPLSCTVSRSGPITNSLLSVIYATSCYTCDPRTCFPTNKSAVSHVRKYRVSKGKVLTAGEHLRKSVNVTSKVTPG